MSPRTRIVSLTAACLTAATTATAAAPSIRALDRQFTKQDVALRTRVFASIDKQGNDGLAAIVNALGKRIVGINSDDYFSSSTDTTGWSFYVDSTAWCESWVYTPNRAVLNAALRRQRAALRSTSVFKRISALSAPSARLSLRRSVRQAELLGGSGSRTIRQGFGCTSYTYSLSIPLVAAQPDPLA